MRSCRNGLAERVVHEGLNFAPMTQAGEHNRAGLRMVARFELAQMIGCLIQCFALLDGRQHGGGLSSQIQRRRWAPSSFRSIRFLFVIHGRMVARFAAAHYKGLAIRYLANCGGRPILPL